MWRQRFGADQALIGKTITLNGHKFTVIGIAPEGFRGTWAGLVADAWVPLMMQAQTRPGGQLLMTRESRWLQLDGRLKDNLTLSQAQAAMSALDADTRSDVYSLGCTLFYALTSRAMFVFHNSCSSPTYGASGTGAPRV